MNKHKHKTQPKTKLEAKGLSLENKKKLDIIYTGGFVKTSRKLFRAMGLRLCFTINITMTMTVTRPKI